MIIDYVQITEGDTVYLLVLYMVPTNKWYRLPPRYLMHNVVDGKLYFNHYVKNRIELKVVMKELYTEVT